MEFALWVLATLMLVGLITWLIIIINKRNSSDSNIKPKTPLDIAKEQYLKGEISAEELEEIARRQV